jgi:broad specificity phosphatase PhoE
MTRLVLVRHGETVWHAENRYAGRTDVALSRQGRRQAEELAEWAAVARLGAIWCSPLSRARETAAAAALRTGMVARVDPRLRELDFGRAEGLTRAEMAERFPRETAAFAVDPVDHHLPGGEDPRAAAERGKDALASIAAVHPGDRVLVVAHTTLIRLTLCRLIGVSPSRYRTLFPFVRNVALTEIELAGDQAAVLGFNAPLRPLAPDA